MQMLKRIGNPDDFADVIVFLASDGARWIKEVTTPVDGDPRYSWTSIFMAGATGLEPATSCVTGRHLSCSVNNLLIS
jgi:hypothetical protein